MHTDAYHSDCGQAWIAHNDDGSCVDDAPRIGTTAEQAYRALSIAAERIGGNNYSRLMAEHRRRGRSPRTFRMTVTDAHRRVIDAMGDVLAGTITPEQAMAILWEYDVLDQRLGDKLSPFTRRVQHNKRASVRF